MRVLLKYTLYSINIQRRMDPKHYTQAFAPYKLHCYLISFVGYLCARGRRRVFAPRRPAAPGRAPGPAPPRPARVPVPTPRRLRPRMNSPGRRQYRYHPAPPMFNKNKTI